MITPADALFCFCFYLSVYAICLLITIAIMKIGRLARRWLGRPTSTQRMITRVNERLMLFLVLCLAPVAAKAQTNALPFPNLDIFTNVPIQTNLTLANFGLATGVANQNGSTFNVVKLDVYPVAKWIVSGEIANGTVASVIQSASAYTGYRAAWLNAEMYGEVGGRKNWITAAVSPSWQGAALFGAAWKITSSSRFCAWGEGALLTSDTGQVFKKAPNAEIRGGLKLFF